MSGVLQLKGLEPLAKGKARLVFQHPKEPAYLVKVIRPDMIEQNWGSGAKWYKRRRRYGRYISYVREIQEYVVAHASHGEALPFLQKIIGFAETDLGLGLVIEAARAPSGALAPTLGQLIESGRFGPRAAAALEALFQQLLECDVTVSDLNVGNAVYTGDDTTPGRFVMIDGLGTSTILPLKHVSRWFNRRSKAGRIERLRGGIARRIARAAQAGVVQQGQF